MNAHGITPHIYPAILARNDTVDRPEREWSRDVWRTTIPLPTPASKVVVVFSDTEATTVSAYLTDVIRDNLAKNNVVIQVARDQTRLYFSRAWMNAITRNTQVTHYTI
jgi:S-formylglutathione hydrolase FrmB